MPQATEESLNQLELEDEAASRQVSLEEKKAIIAAAKKKYGKDWLQFFKKNGGKGSGMDWQALKFRL